MKLASIRQQTLLIALLPMLLAVLLLDLYFLSLRFHSMESNLIEKAQLLANQLGSSSEYAVFSGNTDQVQKEIAVALKQKEVAVIAIQDAAGKFILFSGETVSSEESKAIVEYTGYGVMQDTSQFIWLREPINAQAVNLNELGSASDAADPKILGCVLIKMSKAGLQQDKWESLFTSLFMSMLLIGLTTYIVFRVSRRIVNPIKALNYVARGIGEGELDMRLSPAPAILELNELAKSINDMAKQLQQDRAELDEQTELLRASEERLNEIINTMPISLFIKDAHGRITLMNSACEAQWGVLFANIKGSNGRRFFPPEQMANFLANDHEAFIHRNMIKTEEVVWNSEIRENRTVQTFKKPVFDKVGAPQYLIGISVDITERKLAEIRLQQLNAQLEERVKAATSELRLKKEQAENANDDKTRFLAAASHDLRQPMHALGLFVGELQTRLTTPEQRNIVGKVEESVAALSNLLDALLDISKLDAGVVKPNVSAFSIESLLNRIQQDYASLAQQKGITLKVLVKHVIVHTDPLLLERILINLIANAIRYTPVGGKVLVACRNRGNQLRIEVRDNGIGIAPAEQQTIFREFVQLANKERDRSKGLGLGLAIVDRIVKLLHHDLELRSDTNRGSTFAVFVPRDVQSEVSLDSSLSEVTEVGGAYPSAYFENLTVLVVDDNSLVRKSTQGIAESWGCRVATAATLQEVKTVYPQSKFDLVICDYRLPDGNGIQIADWINENTEHRPHFILISGDTSPDVLKSVNERGIQLLHKPVRPAKLRSLIQYLLNQKTSH